MKWFRFYSEVMHDPKVQMLRPELFRFWVNILCLASEQPERGVLPSVENIAFILRINRASVERYLGELEASGLLQRSSGDPSAILHGRNGGALKPHNWDGRQPKSDDVAERVRNHRKRSSDEKRSEESSECNVTSNVTVSKQIKRGEGELDSEFNSPPPLSREHAREVPASQSPNTRTAEDHADIQAAIQLLAGHPNTESFEIRIGRENNLAGNMSLPGWKWLVAAHKLSAGKVKPSARNRWDYFMGIVRACSIDELPEVREALAPVNATDNGGGPPPPRNSASRKSTPAERRRAENHTLDEVISTMGPDDEE